MWLAFKIFNLIFVGVALINIYFLRSNRTYVSSRMPQRSSDSGCIKSLITHVSNFNECLVKLPRMEVIGVFAVHHCLTIITNHIFFASLYHISKISIDLSRICRY